MRETTDPSISYLTTETSVFFQLRFKPSDSVFCTVSQFSFRVCIYHIIAEKKFMPSGHASHKGTGDKPNTNADGIMDMAADKTVNPEDVLLEGATTNITRTQEFVDYPPATQRPAEETETKNEEK
jgi:hypothetical protein